MLSCALFDVDGTLLTGFIIQTFPRYLAEHGLIESSFAVEIDDVTRRYRMGQVDYRYAAENVPRFYAEAVKGLHETQVQQMAEEYMKDYLPDTILPYTRALIKEAKKHVDLVIALSGSPREPINTLKALGFDHVYGSVFETINSTYTGKITWNLILGEKKAEYAQHIAETHGIDLKRTAAFGDSDQDAQTLELAKLPISLNPNRKMREICEERGWRWYTVDTINVHEISELLESL
ncbi:MAG: HAD-IB family hydrolase [Candidatus Bathyarchaeota archaeon]|nr:HAD-IB family hydrolase [Candidatus Bathyarchaeota archaeon]